MSVDLTILGDATGARRAIADTRAEYGRASDAMTGAARRAAADRRRVENEEIAHTLRLLRASHQAKMRALREETRERQRAARERQRADEAAAKQREKTARAEAAAVAKAEKQKTADAKREATRREQIATREANEKKRLSKQEADAAARAERDKTRELEREEKRRTRLSEQEARRRARAEARAAREATRTTREAGRQRDRRFNRVGDAVVAGGRAAGQFAGEFHAARQGARERGADLQDEVIGAVRQVGVTDLGDVNRYTSMIRERALAEGLRSVDIARAIQEAQSEFSTLGEMRGADGRLRSQADRDAVFRRAIDTAVRGANLGIDMGEFSRTQGMLNNRGLTDADQGNILSWLVGAAERGAIEPGAVTREAMGSIQQRMAAASARLAPTASREERSAAERDAFRQAFAEIQVLKGAGESARLSAGAMSTYERLLGNVGTQGKIRTNIERIGDRDVRERALAAVFDGQGQMRAEMRNPLMFTGAMMNAGVSDPMQLANVFAGTGAGNPQAFLANVRRMQAALAARDTEGKSGLDRIRDFQGANVPITREQEEARANLRRRSDRANLNRNEEARDRALLDNTGALGRLSDQFAEFSARNPVAAAAVNAGGSFLGGLLSGQAVGRGLQAVFGGGAGGGAAGGGGGLLAGARGIAGRALGGAKGLGRAGLGLLGSAASLVGLAAGGAVLLKTNSLEGSNRAAAGMSPFDAAGGGSDADAIRAYRRAGGGRAGVAAAQQATGGAVDLSDRSVERLATALRSAPITATVTPHDAEHAVTRSASSARAREGL